MTEQVPNPDSRVTLGTERDSLGQTRVRLDWRLSPIDILSVVRTQTIVDSELRRAGLGRLYTELRDETPPSGEVPWGVHGGYHHMHSPLSAANRLEYLRAFLRFCVEAW